MARLQVPFGYWNAVGLTARWVSRRRCGSGRAARDTASLNALAAPAIALLLVALVLSYSRGAVLAAVIGVAFWFALVPLRLRALAMLAIGGVAAGAVVAWTLRPARAVRQRRLAGRAQQRRAPPRAAAARRAAGRLRRGARAPLRRRPQPARAGAAGEARDRGAPSRSRSCPVAAVGAAAHSSRGLFGTISHGWHELTTPNAQQPCNSASRLTSTGSMQALYWYYALEIFDANPLAGAGAGSYGVASQRFMTGPDKALNAHGYVFQTLADLGLVGLALSLAVAIGWAIAAARAVRPVPRPRARRRRRGADRPADDGRRRRHLRRALRPSTGSGSSPATR